MTIAHWQSLVTRQQYSQEHHLELYKKLLNFQIQLSAIALPSCGSRIESNCAHGPMPTVTGHTAIAYVQKGWRSERTIIELIDVKVTFLPESSSWTETTQCLSTPLSCPSGGALHDNVIEVDSLEITARETGLPTGAMEITLLIALLFELITGSSYHLHQL